MELVDSGMLREALGGRVLVVFDGRCGLCNGTVRWLIRRDRRDRLRFAAAEGLPEDLRVRWGVAAEAPEAIVAVWEADEPVERVLRGADAVAGLLGELGGGWRFGAKVLRVVPRGLRDWGYGLVARWRYRVWGRLGSCPVPSEAERVKFLWIPGTKAPGIGREQG